MDESYRLLPAEMRPVRGAELDAAALLVEVTVEAAGNAEIAPPTTGDGATWQYGGETITFSSDGSTPMAAQHITPINEVGTEFAVIDERGDASPVQFSADGSMGGERVDAFRREQAGIFAGTIVGSHELLVAKPYVSENEADGDVVLQASVTLTSSGDGVEPSTAVDLRFGRSTPKVRNQHGDTTVWQTHRVEYSPEGDSVTVGSALAAETWVEDARSYDPATGQVDANLVYDPLPEQTAASMQHRYRPQTPLDEAPTISTWQQLVAQPLSPHEVLAASAA
ncbi:MAG TPA: hypothetical protein VLF62_06455 [Candidatus Saccharimonadales bacterium]|nr:hypothetical protein [Candidatus Saccharimonadales bacterium]